MRSRRATHRALAIGAIFVAACAPSELPLASSEPPDQTLVLMQFEETRRLWALGDGVEARWSVPRDGALEVWLLGYDAPHGLPPGELEAGVMFGRSIPRPKRSSYQSIEGREVAMWSVGGAPPIGGLRTEPARRPEQTDCHEISESATSVVEHEGVAWVAAGTTVVHGFAAGLEEMRITTRSSVSALGVSGGSLYLGTTEGVILRATGTMVEEVFVPAGHIGAIVAIVPVLGGSVALRAVTSAGVTVDLRGTTWSTGRSLADCRGVTSATPHRRGALFVCETDSAYTSAVILVDTDGEIARAVYPFESIDDVATAPDGSARAVTHSGTLLELVDSDTRLGFEERDVVRPERPVRSGARLAATFVGTELLIVEDGVGWLDGWAPFDLDFSTTRVLGRTDGSVVVAGNQRVCLLSKM